MIILTISVILKIYITLGITDEKSCTQKSTAYSVLHLSVQILNGFIKELALIQTHLGES